MLRARGATFAQQEQLRFGDKADAPAADTTMLLAPKRNRIPAHRLRVAAAFFSALAHALPAELVACDSTTASDAGDDSDVRPVIALDCDDVLCLTNVKFIDWLNRNYNLNFELSDFTSYDMNKCFGGPRELWDERYQAFENAGGNMGLEVMPGAHEALEELSKDFDCIVVTSRGSYMQETTEKWLRLHFHGLIKKLRMTMHWEINDETPHDKKIQKSDICLEEGAVALVDDYIKYCLEAATKLPLVMHFSLDDRWVWSQDLMPDKLPENVKPVKNWKQVVATLKAAKPQLVAAYKRWKATGSFKEEAPSAPAA